MNRCDTCQHQSNKTEENFFCRLHDATYSKDQENCEDFEAIEIEEQDNYCCD